MLVHESWLPDDRVQHLASASVISAAGERDRAARRSRGLMVPTSIPPAGARMADVVLEANVLLIFGNPSVGNP
jgi:hypothetical protein